MPKKSEQTLVPAGWKITDEQKRVLDEEAHARRYNGTSELVRDIFDSWIEENHKSNNS